MRCFWIWTKSKTIPVTFKLLDQDNNFWYRVDPILNKTTCLSGEFGMGGLLLVSEVHISIGLSLKLYEREFTSYLKRGFNLYTLALFRIGRLSGFLRIFRNLLFLSWISKLELKNKKTRHLTKKLFNIFFNKFSSFSSLYKIKVFDNK